jgi:hypothetical protein
MADKLASTGQVPGMISDRESTGRPVSRSFANFAANAPAREAVAMFAGCSWRLYTGPRAAIPKSPICSHGEGAVTEDQKKAVRALGYWPIEEDTFFWSRAIRNVQAAIADLEARGEDPTQFHLPSGAGWFDLLAEMEQGLAQALRVRAERLAAERQPIGETRWR